MRKIVAIGILSSSASTALPASRIPDAAMRRLWITLTPTFSRRMASGATLLSSSLSWITGVSRYECTTMMLKWMAADDLVHIKERHWALLLGMGLNTSRPIPQPQHQDDEK